MFNWPAISHSSLKRFSNLRYRLLALVLCPLLLLSGTVILLAAKWSTNYTYEQLYAKVNTDLRVAGESFQRIQDDGQRELSWLANSAILHKALEEGELTNLLALLEQQRKTRGFDFLKLRSADGKHALVQTGWQQRVLRQSPLTQQVLHGNGETDVPAGLSGIEIYEAAQWQSEPGMAAMNVVLPLVPTARAAPSTRQDEDRAMVIRTLQPVYNELGNRLALLEGGVLLNRNFEFVDEIRDLVYGPGSLAPGSRGTVTVFLEDVRITTNVLTRNESRALGTRVSAEVREAVLNRGESWINRAFVVNDWYISAYEPILDVHGERVGMLYAGYLEAPFRAELYKAILVLSALVIAGSLAAVLAAVFGARAIFTPIETITTVVRATAAGQYRRIGPIDIGSEIGELASQFDSMLDTLETHRQRIEGDSALLEDKVRHRTAELETQNQRLQDSIDLLHQTRRQLANAEKLAALGELTAGVAHEINNPTAVILGNMDVLVADLGRSGECVQTEIDLIIEQVYRIRSITDRLLQYSRSESCEQECTVGKPLSGSDVSPMLGDTSKQALHTVSLHDTAADSLKLLTHELEGRNINVRQVRNGRLLAVIDHQELQQILVNLLSNAIQAINQDGMIEIETSDQSGHMARIAISDSGCGIQPQHVPRVFDPFFTSGKDSGTGLGLSVSYGIVRRFGGDLRVRSSVGVGSTFEVVLPAVVGSDAATAT